MTRELLLENICPTDCTDDCVIVGCDYCNEKLNELLDEHDKQIRADAIDDFANWLVKQGILGSRCISDGEITDYGKVYAKKYKEQLKAGEHNAKTKSES